MTVKEIIKRWLDDKGYDGLCHPDTQCACRLDNLAPCHPEKCFAECEPAYEVNGMFGPVLGYEYEPDTK